MAYFMHPVDNVLSRLMIGETSFAIYALYYLQYKKNLVSLSKNGGEVNQDNLHTNKQSITTQLFLAIFFKGNEIIVCKRQTKAIKIIKVYLYFWKLIVIDLSF